MKNILKQLGGLDINLRINNFDRAVIRLTSFYTIGVFFVVLLFSLLLYVLFASELHERIENYRISADLEGVVDDVEEPFHEIEENLMSIIVVSDLVVLVVVIGVSYILSRKTLQPLADSYRKQERFIADASHELRTPLSVMKIGAETMLQRDRTNEEYKNFISDMLHETNRLSRISNDLLRLSRDIESIRKKFLNVSLSDICTKQVAAMASYASARGIHIHGEVCSSVNVSGNYDDLVRVLVNMLKNAIDYNEQGGSVMLELHKRNKNVSLIIADTGIGISPEDVPHIFERFYKGNKARSSPGEGTGLGLSLVHEIVTSHHGTISVSPNIPRGTIFTISFPCT